MMWWLLPSLILAGAIAAAPEDMLKPLHYVHDVHLFHDLDQHEENKTTSASISTTSATVPAASTTSSTFTTTVDPEDCIPPFMDIEGRCLYYNTTHPTNWTTAQKACEDINGNLIVIPSEEQDPLSEYLHNITVDSYIYGAFWTGGNYQQEEDNWIWLSGNPVEGDWEEEDNSTAPENCLGLDTRNAIYRDYECSWKWAYLCEPGPCYAKVCGTNAHCVVANYVTANCTCNEGYEGDADTSCTEIDPCDEAHCGAHAVCTSDGWPNFHCTCEDGYAGDPPNTACEYNPCYNITCGTHAHCVKLSNSTTECQCNNGYTGNPQQGCSSIDYCKDVTCGEHAACHVIDHEGKCQCEPDYPNGDPNVQCSGGDQSIGSSSLYILLLALSVTILLSYQNVS